MAIAIFSGQALIKGAAKGRVLHAGLGLSFWGGVDPRTGMVIDRQHPLLGQCITGKVLAIPSGRGSCTGSAVLLELIMQGTAPAAIIFCEPETILPLGAMVSDALFGRSLAMVRLHRSAFEAFAACTNAEVSDGEVTGSGAALTTAVPSFPALPDIPVLLTEGDQAMLAGDEGPARQLAMRIILAMARLKGAEQLIDLTQAHLDCCIHTGPVSIMIAERMRDLGARVKIPTTLNAVSIDRSQWRLLGVAAERASEVERQTEAYLAMGARPSFTCAPYLLDSTPAAGEQIGWAESNAVAFANSVLGARTEKYPDYFDLCLALTGRAPLSGCHIEDHRKARVHIHFEAPVMFDDALFPLLGYLAGGLSPHAIPVLTGLERTAPTRDDLKAFSAAFATTSAAPMFHVVGVTPEAPDLASVVSSEGVEGPLCVGTMDLRTAWTTLNGDDDAPVSCIAIGNPHSSFEELERLAHLCDGRKKGEAIKAMVTVGRAIHARAVAEGVAKRLERFGFQLLQDTCWCMIEEPVIQAGQGDLLTNSGKYVHYGPGLTGRRVRYASLEACVEAAVTCRFCGALPSWLAQAE